MTSNKRTKSISRKINSRAVFKMFWCFLLLDLAAIFVAASLWCLSVEYNANGDFNIEDSHYFTSIRQVEGAAPPEDDFIDLPGAKLEKALSRVVYVCGSEVAYAGFFLQLLAAGILMLMIVEALMLLGSVLWGAREVRRDLATLDELAFKADMLGRAVNLDPQALDELEEAINRISPTGEGTQLHTDNAELQELETAINGLLERMRESYRQQNRFVSDASHELRTPISVLQGYVNMLDRWGKEDPQILEESIDAIKSETEHMKKLVEQLLFLARGDSGKTKLTMEHFSLNEMMQEVYEESQMIDTGHSYQYRPCEEDIWIKGDVAMLKQTARILIDNASKYTQQEDAILLKTVMADGVPGFVIQDEGIGIGSSDVIHMFDRFYRSDPARTKDSGGTGLGLSIAKWIVDRHGGHFEVLSREQLGTRITVWLPQK